MPKDPEPSHLQRDFTLAAIREGVRTDGRRLDEARPWALEWVGGEDGGVECRLGKTRCVLSKARRPSWTIADRPELKRQVDELFPAPVSSLECRRQWSGRGPTDRTRA